MAHNIDTRPYIGRLTLAAGECLEVTVPVGASVSVLITSQADPPVTVAGWVAIDGQVDGDPIDESAAYYVPAGGAYDVPAGATTIYVSTDSGAGYAFIEVA